MRISGWSSDLCSSDLVGERQLADGDLNLAAGLAAQLADRLDDLGHAAPVGGVVVAQSAAVGVERQPAIGCPQALVGDEGAALALLAEAQVLDEIGRAHV